MVLAFSGHRPEKLPWGDDEGDPRCAALKQQIKTALAQLAREGYDTFLCGMARGCDFYFAEAVLELGMRLEAYLPCPSQADRWSHADRERQTALLLRCGAVYLVEPCYSPGCMLRRNRKMVDRCDLLLTVYDGSPGGTGAAVEYARSKDKRISGLWL